jgi:anti-sigma B factor antagonist
MAAKLFGATVRSHDGVAVIDLSGEVNAGADAQLEAAYSEAASTGATSILLNFEAVDYINSTGIALIVGLLARSKKERRDVLACGLSEHYRKIFEITRVADFMHLYQDEQTAIKQAS